MEWRIIAREKNFFINHQYDDEALRALDSIRTSPVFQAENQYEAAQRIDEFAVYWATLRNPVLEVILEK